MRPLRIAVILEATISLRSSCLALATVLGAGGCSFDSSAGGHAGGDGSPAEIDARPGGGGDGAPSDGPPGDPCNDWQPAAPFAPCSIAAADRGPGLILDVDGTYTFDTASGVLTDPDDQPVDPQPFSELINGDTVRLLSVGTLQLADGSILRVIGEQPLLIAAWGNVVIDGELDLSSGRGLGRGAGAAALPCALTQDGDTGLTGGGGGAGGSFGDLGGDGGVGSGVSAPANDAVIGAPGLRGGCGGGRGGVGTVGQAVGGPSGGAVAVSALFSITINGTIHAGGGGGAGGADLGGGGGAGSGGLIWLEAVVRTDVMSGGVVTANGGGGGEGSSATSAGSVGQPAPTDGTKAQPGKGGGANDGGDGGLGSGDATTTGEKGHDGNNTGGGGGGGGAGIIRVDGTFDSAGDVSPAETTYPPG